MNNREEKMIYQKLFNIYYNNKEFTIFIDQYGRRTFLEIDSSGNYIYPLIDDFIALHKIYNERDIFTTYTYKIGENLANHKNKKVIFTEYVKYVSQVGITALAAVIVANAITTITMSKRMKLEHDGENIKIAIDYVDGSLIKNAKELDSVLGYKSVSTEEIINTINANNKMDEYHKKCAIDLVNFIKNKYPDTDARIFYENMKNVSVKEKPKFLMPKGCAGTYNSLDNIVSLREDYKDSREVIIHELAHSYHHWVEDTVLSPKYRVDPDGNFLDEAMTNKIIDGLVKTHTYRKEGRVLDYFLTCVDYDYYDYEQEGIAKLISLLKEKYDNVDIDYIINVMDTMMYTNYNIDEKIKIEDNQELLDEMFKICISNIDINSLSIYQPLIDFLKVIDHDYNPDLLSHYLNEYNAILEDNKYDQNKMIKDANTLYTGMKAYNILGEKLEEHISKQNIASLSKGNLYQPLKKFLEDIKEQYADEYISNEETIKLMCHLLDIYNDVLYSNGYTKDDTITSETMMEKIGKFKDIKILGYTVTDDEVIYPIIDIKNIDKVYDTTNKIPVLNEQGKVILIDKKDTMEKTKDDTGRLYYTFINSLFQNLDNDYLQLDQKYWQDMFNLKEYQYKKVPIYLDGVQLSKEYLEEYLLNTYITFGQEDETLTFTVGNIDELTIGPSGMDEEQISLLKEDTYNYMYRLINPNQEESLQLDQALNDYYSKTKTVIVPLAKFIDGILQSQDNFTSIELRKFLNEDYLKEQITGDDLSSPISSRYNNFTYDVENDTVKIHPIYHVNIDGYDETLNMNEIRLNMNHNTTYMMIRSYLKETQGLIDGDGKTTATIYLETVLDYYGILQEDQQEYHFSEGELLELYNNYSHDVYIDKENRMASGRFAQMSENTMRSNKS